MKVEIIRTFDKRFQSGDVVDASGWAPRNLECLIKQNRVRAVPEDSQEKRKPGRPRKEHN